MNTSHECVQDQSIVQTIVLLADDRATLPEISMAEGEPTTVIPQTVSLNVGGAGAYEVAKRILDFFISLVLLILVSPFIFLCGLLVKITSPGPAIYTQLRQGRAGKPYVIFKLRSMRHNCETHSGIKWCARNDDRITPFGKFLRKSHIDELPQLWNVLRGEMSLIGPRPERPELIASLQKALPYYRDRLLVLPGLTGLAQIQLPADTDIESVRRKLEVDRLYVERRGFALDCKILAGTVLYLVGVSIPKFRRLLKLPFPTAVTSTLPVAVTEPIHQSPAAPRKRHSDSKQSLVVSR